MKNAITAMLLVALFLPTVAFAKSAEADLRDRIVSIREKIENLREDLEQKKRIRIKELEIRKKLLLKLKERLERAR